MAESIATPAPAQPGTRSYRWLAAPLLAFALFALTAGLLGRGYDEEAAAKILGGNALRVLRAVLPRS